MQKKSLNDMGNHNVEVTNLDLDHPRMWNQVDHKRRYNEQI